MATLDIDGLSQSLGQCSISDSSATVQSCSVLTNPLDVWRWELAALLARLTDAEVGETYRCIQWPNDICSGDLSVTLPKLRPGCNAAALSSELVDKFPRNNPLFMLPLPDKVHLRVFIKLELIPRLLVPYILDREKTYGHGTGNAKPIKNLVIDFSSPNITTEFQGKHLRSTIIGAFISRLYESVGWNVKRINYLGDWGKPIALLYVGYVKFGSQEAYESDPVGHLLQVYHHINALFQPEQAASRQARDDAAKEGKDEGEAQLEIESRGIFAERNEAFKKLEEGDEEVKGFWQQIRNVIVEDYEGFYSRLGVRFDEYTGESQVSTAAMTEVEQMLKDKGLLEESAGAWMVDMTKVGARAGHAIIRDRSGSSTYLLRDLAAVLERSRKYSFDKMIYVVASDSNVLHFTQMFKILEAMDKPLANKLQHVKFGEVSKMSAVLEKGYKPQAILDKCEDAMTSPAEADVDKLALLGNSEQASKALAISSLLIQELSTRLVSTHTFDTASLASFKLGSGPDLQYWHAKTFSLLSGQTVTTELSDEEFSDLSDDDDRVNLLRLLAQYPEVVNATFHSLEPSNIVTYLASVTDQLSDCLDEVEGDIDVSPSLAALLEATRIVLANGMKLLGLDPVYSGKKERADTPIAE